MDPSNVDSVFTAGPPVTRDGRLIGSGVAHILRQAGREREALIRRAASGA